MTLSQLLSRDLDGKKIGLLGGSFNPAHDGHVAMSLFALARLKLDEVWWLVSPQNPLKSLDEMKPMTERATRARALAAPHKSIVVTTIESELGTRYTIDSLRAITSHFPHVNFVWLMGDDNLQTFHLWKSWQEIFRLLPIAVFRRSEYVVSRARCEAAAFFANAEVPVASVEDLAVSKPPAWVVLDNELNPLSATQIRQSSQPT